VRTAGRGRNDRLRHPTDEERSELAECSGWDIDFDGNTTILSVIKTDPTTGAPKSEKDVVTFGFSGKVFVGKLTAKY